MVLSEIKDTLVFANKKPNSIPVIERKIESQLNQIKERTSISDNVITFKAVEVFRALVWGDISYSNLLFRIYKEGKIVIQIKDNTLKIMWTVKLDTLYFLAFYVSIIAGVTTSFFGNIKLSFSISISIAIFLMFISLGILFIKYKMTELIEASVYSKH